MALQTITQKHRDLRRVSIHVSHHDMPSTGANIREILGEQIYGQWLNLDHFLNQIWESLSIRSKVVCIIPEEGHDIEDYIGYLLPEMKKRGTIDLVERPY